MKETKPTVLVIGPVPPPAHGVSVFTATLLGSPLKESFRLVHLDISDRRSLANVGHWDLRNVVLALSHGLKFQWMLLRQRPALIYLPISETKLGFLRDCLFLAPARLFGYKLVVQVHGGYHQALYAESNLIIRWLMRYCLRGVTRAIVLGETFRRKLDGLVPLDRVRVVPIGIESQIFEAAKQAGRARKNGKHTILYLGTLVESKGFADLLHAVPYVVQKRNDVEFVFVGDNSLPEAESARQWAKQAAVDSYVRFVGPKWGADKIEAFLQADTFAFPTWYPLEGQPIVVLEAMSAGLPVLTTRHATIPDILGEEGAVYVREKNPEDIADKLCYLLGNQELRARMRETNQAKFLQSHTTERFAANMGRAFEEALSA